MNAIAKPNLATYKIPQRASMLAVAASLIIGLGGCESPGGRGAMTGAALGGGIALLAHGSPAGVIGGALVGGGVGYVVGKNTSLFK